MTHKAKHETDPLATRQTPEWISYDPRVHFVRLPAGMGTIWQTAEGVYWFGLRAPGAKLSAGCRQQGYRMTLEEAKNAVLEAAIAEAFMRSRHG